jgi:hypothetical protein
MNDLEDLAKTYGPAAPYSEHKRGDRVRYISAEGEETSGVIEWVQASTESIPMKYIIVPDEPGQFLDFALPGDILTQEGQEPILHKCPYCPSHHYDVSRCPLKRRWHLEISLWTRPNS